MRAFALILPIAGIAWGATALAGLADRAEARERHPRGTLAQRIACTPDVFRLCDDEIPNIPAIVACLIKNKSKLNPDCRAVFEGKLR